MLFPTHKAHMDFHAKHIGIKGRPRKRPVIQTPSGA
jgi:hypothetical protein